MSVFADILVLAVLIAAAWLGAKRGLLKSLAGLLIIVVALLGASWAADHLSEPVTQWIEPRVTQRVERKLEESHAADAGQMLQAFSFRGSGLQKMLDTVHHCHQAAPDQHRQRSGGRGSGPCMRRPYAVCGRVGHAALRLASDP